MALPVPELPWIFVWARVKPSAFALCGRYPAQQPPSCPGTLEGRGRQLLSLLAF